MSCVTFAVHRVCAYARARGLCVFGLFSVEYRMLSHHAIHVHGLCGPVLVSSDVCVASVRSGGVHT